MVYAKKDEIRQMSKIFTVAIYLPDKVNLYHYAIISSLLSTKFEGGSLFNLLRFSDESPVATTDPDVQIKAPTDWADVRAADALVIPSWTDLDTPPTGSRRKSSEVLIKRTSG